MSYFDKVEFSDLYKFLTSVGLIFIASAFIIPWLFIKLDSGLISQADYDGLTESSKSLINYRIEIIANSTTILPYIFWILIGLGVISLSVGIVKWLKKQKVIDYMETLKLIELESKIKELNPKEIELKAEQEVKKEISNTRYETEKTDPSSSMVTEASIDKLKNNLLDMEKLFYQKIIDYNSFNYDVKFNVKLHDEFEHDIYLKSINPKYRDIFIEIKFLQSRLSMNTVKDAVGFMIKSNNKYFNITKKHAKSILFLIIKNDIADENEIKRFKLGVNDYVSQFRLPNLKPFVLSEREAENFDVKSIIP